MLHHFLKQLQHNLGGGLRLALLRPVRQVEFRISPAQFVALAIIGALCASLVDLVLVSGAAQWHSAALGDHVRDSALLLSLTWVLALCLRAPAVTLALPVVLLAATWIPDVIFAAIVAAPRWLGVAGTSHYLTVWWLMLGWSLVIAWRALEVVLHGRGRYSLTARAVGIAAVVGGMFVFANIFPAPHLWEERPPPTAAAGEEQLPKVESEEVLSVQPRLLFDALTGLEERVPDATNFYFVGFAGDASQDVFRNDMEGAQEVADAHLGTEGRSVILVNSPKTVLDLPLATLTNLSAALATVGRLIDTEEDVVLVYLSSHGTADHRLYVNFPPLVLQQVTPTSLSRTLQEAAIKWKVIVVSACYSGGYVEPLKDPYTLIITSSRADRTSFGCDNASEYTYFGQAFFQEALKRTSSLPQAFAIASASIARREQAEGLLASEPQIYVGEAIGRKLGGAARKTKTNIAGVPKNPV
ncbi:MAG: C13 family peptidase [Betaproteobacteria bacterium]